LLGDNPGHHGQGDRKKKSHNHCAAGGAVAYIPLCMAGHQVDQVAQRFHRSGHKIAEAGMLRSGQPPDNAPNNDAPNDVARPFVQFARLAFLFAAEIGDGKGDNERPVPWLSSWDF
jgi:hypothetical protein